MAAGALSAGANIAGDLISFGLSSHANRKAKKTRAQALEQARSEISAGYDTAGSALDAGQKALETGYSDATTQRHNVAANMGQTAQDTYTAQEGLWAPWMGPGMNAYQNLDRMLNDPTAFNDMVSKYSSTPQFQFQMQQATQQIKRQAAAAGNRLGANQITALSDRAGQVAGQEFDKWIGHLENMAQTGLQATGQLSNARTALGQGQTNALQYGDTSQWDINKGKDVLGVNQQRGDLAINKADNMANLALGQGNVKANYALAQGQLNTNLVGNLFGEAGGGGFDVGSIFGGGGGVNKTPGGYAGADMTGGGLGGMGNVASALKLFA